MHRLLEYTPQLEFLNEDAFSAPAARQAGSGLPHARSEEGQLALAADLLEVADPREFEQFLADLVSKVSAVGRRVLDTPLGKAVLGGLARAAGPLLPIGAARYAGPLIDAFGTNKERDPLRRAARVFGLELEGLSPEDAEFEVARRIVRFATEAVTRAGAMGGYRAPQRCAQAALRQAARRYAPGLLQQQAQAGGQWARQGGQLVVFDC